LVSSKRIGHALRSPVAYLSLTGAVGGLLGLIRALLTADILGPQQLGVLAVVAGLFRGMQTFVDVRLADLACQLYYRTDPMTPVDPPSYRGSVLLLCVAGNGLLSLGAAGLGIVVSLCCLDLFTDAAIPVSWLLAQAVIIIAASVGNTASFLQRLTEKHHAMGGWQLFNQALFLILLLPPLIWTASIGGFYVGCVVASLATAASAVGILYHFCRRHLELPLPGRNWACAWPDYRSQFGALFYCNLLGYGKMLHRGFDVLLVGWFASDRLTGIYRLARSLTDGVGFLFDALNQVYWPRLLDLLRRDDHRRFRFEARRLLLAASGITAGLLLLQVWMLPLLNTHVLSAEFSGITPLMLVLTVPFFFAAGLHLWIWPIVIHREYLPRFTTYSGIAVAAHYGLALGGLACFPTTILPAAVGYLAYYPVLYGLTCLSLLKVCGELTPFRIRLPGPQRLDRHPRGGTAL